MSDDEIRARQLAADRASARLREGNERFIAGQARAPTFRADRAGAMVVRQQPFATILGCSDSRVPPEFIFDAWLDELFVVRVAGNVLGPSVLATLQYAAYHLDTPLFVVLGHEGCGAVKAALAYRFEQHHESERIEALLDMIVPSLDGLDAVASPELRVHAAVEANVRRTLRLIAESAVGAAQIARGVRLQGAVYELHSGRVRFLD
jgi:carbonic anhydrase